jgi:threonine/homoserine/homoserine lactone efflux protein
VGGSLGIAIMGAIVAASATPGVRNPSAFIDGFHHALLTAAGLTIAGALVAALTLGGRTRHEPERAVAFEAG